MKNIANNLNFSENLKAVHIARQLMEKDASETSSTELDDDDWNVERDISGTHSLISLSVIVVFFVFLKHSPFSRINFQFPFISFAVKTHSHRIFLASRFLNSRRNFFSLCVICSVPSTTLARGSLTVQMNAECVCVCVYAKCMLRCSTK